MATLVHEPDDAGTRIWLGAEAVYHELYPHRGPLKLAKRTIRSRCLRLALKAVTAWTDKHGVSWEQVRLQAAKDYATHAACARVPDPLRYAALTSEEQ